MNCVFLRRGYPPPLIIDLLENATIITTAGVDSSTEDYVYIYESYFPQSGTAYALLFCNGGLGIYKVVNRGTATRVALLSPISGDGLNYMQKNTDPWNSSNVYYLGKYNYKYNGATMVLFSTTNPNADNILSNATYTRLGGRDSTSYDSLYTSDTQYKAALVATSTRMTLWHCNGSSWSKGSFTTSNAAGVTSGNTLGVGSCYGASIIGLS